MHKLKLPPHGRTLYELCKLSDDVLEAKLADGTIHPGMQRKDAIALRKPEGSQQNAEDRGAEAEPAPTIPPRSPSSVPAGKLVLSSSVATFSIGSAVTAFAGRCPKNSRRNFRMP